MPPRSPHIGAVRRGILGPMESKDAAADGVAATRPALPTPVARASLDEAASLAPLTRGIPLGVRLRHVKRAIRRVSRPVIREQADFNHAATQVMEDLAAALTQLRDSRTLRLDSVE